MSESDPVVEKAIQDAHAALDTADPKLEAERKRTLVPEINAWRDRLGDSVRRQAWGEARHARRELRRVLKQLSVAPEDW